MRLDLRSLPLIGLQMDPSYIPQNSETRQVYGISLRQNRNDAKIDATLFNNIVTAEKSVCSLACTSSLYGKLLIYFPSCRNPPLSTSLLLHWLSSTHNRIALPMLIVALSLAWVRDNNLVFTAHASLEARLTIGG